MGLEGVSKVKVGKSGLTISSRGKHRSEIIAIRLEVKKIDHQSKGIEDTFNK